MMEREWWVMDSGRLYSPISVLSRGWLHSTFPFASFFSLFSLSSRFLIYAASIHIAGLAFFAVALFAGISMALVYIFIVYGTVAAAGYTLVYAAVNQRIEGGQQYRQAPQQRLRYPQYVQTNN